MKAAVDRKKLFDIVPISENKLYELEKAGEFPKKFVLAGKYAWNRDEIEAWLDEQQEQNTGKSTNRKPDVRKRKIRPVKEKGSA
ncbi:AlpA family phage regulatory protein [Sodalis endosymbiont of Spalangia cameroni]|uniref:helix-turn-helix transcriptional regulator n=1 Tax=Sodalis praecaptivus TaxID=1239307 RepID=UPI0031F73636